MSYLMARFEVPNPRRFEARSLCTQSNLSRRRRWPRTARIAGLADKRSIVTVEEFVDRLDAPPNACILSGWLFRQSAYARAAPILPIPKSIPPFVNSFHPFLAWTTNP
jgi:hypothetical protein